ncbi:MAG: beta-mannanase [Verrucomicrobia bacterium]|nr:MAG: beta-mannanase [Verrucomicrobiota bacterium]
MPIWQAKRGPYSCAVKAIHLLLATCAATLHAQDVHVAVPAAGKLYHGLYWGGVGTDEHDPTEHDVTPIDVARYEQAVGKQTAWIYFANNWFESRKFPAEMCNWIRDLRKIPYVRLMLRSDVDQKHSEKFFSVQKIIADEFDADLRAWARDAKNFGSAILIEWGTEPNGDWFSWNGKWNGGPGEGPARYIAAYRHIVDLMRAEGADNLQWIWHVNWLDEPEKNWNRFENYFPGEDYCDWVALSAYGPTTPMTTDSTESLAFKMREAYPRLVKLAPGKPIIIAEFGCDLHNRRVNAADWAKTALEDLFASRWPGVIGFCWWNEGWQNDDYKKHDTDMIVMHDIDLTRVFRDELAKHADKIQETPIEMTKHE